MSPARALRRKNLASHSKELVPKLVLTCMRADFCTASSASSSLKRQPRLAQSANIIGGVILAALNVLGWENGVDDPGEQSHGSVELFLLYETSCR